MYDPECRERTRLVRVEAQRGLSGGSASCFQPRSLRHLRATPSGCVGKRQCTPSGFRLRSQPGCILQQGDRLGRRTFILWIQHVIRLKGVHPLLKQELSFGRYRWLPVQPERDPASDDQRGGAATRQYVAAVVGAAARRQCRGRGLLTHQRSYAVGDHPPAGRVATAFPAPQVCALNLVERHRKPRIVQAKLYQPPCLKCPVSFRPNPVRGSGLGNPQDKHR